VLLLPPSVLPLRPLYLRAANSCALAAKSGRLGALTARLLSVLNGPALAAPPPPPPTPTPA